MAKPSFWHRLLDQFKDVMVVTLLTGAGISLLAGRLRDAITITAIVVFNAVVGATQAGSADGSIEALQRMSAPRARLLRDGRPVDLPVADVVPGDVLLLEAGDRIPADAQVLEASDSEADESLLTGESLPVAKQAAAAGAKPDGGLGRPDMLFAGTTLSRGRCVALVTATGMRTEMGRIARLLGDAKVGPTPLQTRMAELGRTLVKGSLLLCGGVVLAGLLRRQPLIDMLMTGISLAVAAIPEGLPTFVTLGLATGVRFMGRRKALVRRLQAVETLGSATVICSDKTGTLTANEMTVRQLCAGGRIYDVEGSGYSPQGAFSRDGMPVAAGEHPELMQLLSAAAICGNSHLEQSDKGWTVVGDATEGALLVAAAKAGIQPAELLRSYRRKLEVPFDAARRRMTVVCEGPEGLALYTKGAPETILPLCTHALRRGKRVRLTRAERQRIMKVADDMAGNAYRVLAAAHGRPTDGASLEAELTFLGLAGMMDPPRAEVPPALARCRRAGIRVVMLTGDHPRTAAAIAREIGLIRAGDLVLTGDDIGAMTDRQLYKCVERLRVCARVSPEQKLRFVRALRAHGHVVAMTGDGVNDAPAVREADIGIAMGIAGTEVTKEAASLILADDNFATIVAAVEQGRVTYNNIRKSVRYLLASNMGEMVVMGAAVALGLPLPLLPLQILWLNLVGDGLPALALSAEPADGTEMAQRPRPRSESIFAGGLGRQIVRHGLQLGAAALGLLVWALRIGKPLAVVRTLTLSTLVLGQLVYMIRTRRGAAKARRTPRQRNPLAGWAVAGSAALLAGSVLLPPLRQMLQLAPLRPGEWAAAGLAAAIGNMSL